MTEPTATEWAIEWPQVRDDEDRYEPWPERRARQIAALYRGSGVQLVKRTVTYGPWTVVEDQL